MFGMTDRPTDPTDRPALRSAAPEHASVHPHRPTDRRPTTTTAEEHQPSTDRPTAAPTAPRRQPRPDRRIGAAWKKLTYRPKPTSKPTGEPAAHTPPPPRPTTPSVAPTGKPTDRTPTAPTSRVARIGMRTLLIATALLLAVVVTAPISLSAQDLVGWAESPTGLGLEHFWAVVVFISLDAAAGVCVLLSVYCAWRGEPAGGFGIAVWVFALTSAFANYQHGQRPGAPGDAWWFFPAMSLLGPALLEMVTRKVREWVQRNSNRRGKRMPHFGWRRWIPGVGSWRDTYGAYRTANLLGIETVDLAIAWYHWLCPDGSLRVARAMRAREVHADLLPTDQGDTPTDRPAVDGARLEPTDRTRPTSTGEATRKPTDQIRPTAPAVENRPTVIVRPATRPTVPAQPKPTSPAPTATNPTDRPAFSDAAIRNARLIRSRYGTTDSLRLATVRGDNEWSYDKANPAFKAYLAGADLTQTEEKEDASNARTDAHAG